MSQCQSGLDLDSKLVRSMGTAHAPLRFSLHASKSLRWIASGPVVADTHAL